MVNGQSDTAVSKLREASTRHALAKEQADATRRERNRLIVEAARQMPERKVAELAGVSGVYVHKLKHGERPL